MTAEIDGIAVSYASWGEKSEKAVVMLHGWGANKELFRQSAELCAKKYYVVAPDMPGFGCTPEPPSAWCVDDYTDFVIKFISSLGIKSVILLGHSFGGRVIIKAASSRSLPFNVERIILVDSAGIRPEKTDAQKKKESIVKFGKKLVAGSPKLLSKLQSMAGSADYRAASPLMRQVLVNVVNEDLTDLLPKIKQEVLLIWGTADTATPVSDAEKMEKLLPNAGLARIEGAGHFSFLENAPVFNAVLTSYLKL